MDLDTGDYINPHTYWKYDTDKKLNQETEISKQKTDILNQKINQDVSIVITFENIDHNNQVIQEFSKNFTSINKTNSDFIIVDKLNLLRQILIDIFPKKR